MENNNTKKTIGKRINTLLAEQGKTQKELADELGVKPNVISYFCKGERTPNTEQIIKIAKYFNVSADYLLGLQKEPTNDPNIIAVTEYTGLSKNAVKNIIELQYPFGKILDKILEHEKLPYYFTIMKIAFDLKYKIIKNDFHKPTNKDEKKAEQAEKILESTPYTVAFTIDELYSHEYQLSNIIKKIIDDVFNKYADEKEASDNGNNNPTNK